MDVRATLNYLRQSPRKVRLVTNLLPGLSVAQAEAQLDVVGKAAAQPLKKLLRSAVANAKHNYQLTADKLYVKRCLTNEGPKLRRFTPKAFGRGAAILKRSSRITLILSERSATDQGQAGSTNKLSARATSPVGRRKPEAGSQKPAAGSH